jgi:predicted MFS family arabinose efflux permease
VTPERFRGQAIGYVLLASPLAMAIAASLGVFLSNRYGFAVLFLSCVGLSLCSLFFSLVIKGRENDRPRIKVSARDARLIDLKIAVPAFINFLNYFVGGALFAFIPLYGVKSGITNPGFFFSAVAVMLFTGRILGGKILVAYDKEKIIVGFLSIFVAALVILSFSHTVLMFVFVGLVWGTALAFLIPAWHMPSSMRALQRAQRSALTRCSWILEWPSGLRSWAWWCQWLATGRCFSVLP